MNHNTARHDPFDRPGRGGIILPLPPPPEPKPAVPIELARLNAEIEAVDGDDPTHVEYHHWQSARARLRKRLASVTLQNGSAQAPSPSPSAPSTINHQPPTNKMPTEIKIPMTRDKECKGSVRFATEDPKAAVTKVYVSRELAGIKDAKQVVVTVAVN